MPGSSPFSYAVYRLVPRVERGERINVGVVVFSRPLDFLAARTGLDEERVRALWPDLDPDDVRPHLSGARADRGRRRGRRADRGSSTRPRASTGSSSPSSTIIQPSAVHTGLCGRPEEELDRLFRSLVLHPSA